MELTSEKELEDFLFKWTPDGPVEEEYGHPLGINYKKLLRQVNIQGYGVIDLLSVDISCQDELMPCIDIDIIELKKGTIDILASDHAPHTLKEKEKFVNAPSGMPGVETMFTIMLSRVKHNNKGDISILKI